MSSNFLYLSNHYSILLTVILFSNTIDKQEYMEVSRVQTLQSFCKVYYSVFSRIKDFDPIISKFKSVLPCNSIDASQKFHNHPGTSVGVML